MNSQESSMSLADWLFFINAAAAAAKSLQSCPTLCDPIDGSPPGSAVPGTLQARTLEWVAISFSNEGKWKVKVKSLSRVQLFATPWTAAYQAPPSMGFSRQEYWSGVPLPSPFINASYMQVCLRGKILTSLRYVWGFQGGTSSKEAAPQCRRSKRCGFDPRVRKIPGGGHGNPLQYSCLENPKDRGTWWIHRVKKSETSLKWLSMHSHMHTCFSFYLSICLEQQHIHKISYFCLV